MACPPTGRCVPTTLSASGHGSPSITRAVARAGSPARATVYLGEGVRASYLVEGVRASGGPEVPRYLLHREHDDVLDLRQQVRAGREVGPGPGPGRQNKQLIILADCPQSPGAACGADPAPQARRARPP
jgi:hypothetical protein